METDGEIFLVPFFGQGHLFPCVELCKHFSARNFKTILFISSNLSSSVPSALQHNPLVEIAEIPGVPPPPPPPEADIGSEPGFGPAPGPGSNPFIHHHQQMGQAIEGFLSGRSSGPPRPVCAVLDVMMEGMKESFAKFDIPMVLFFTSGATSTAMECAMWRARVGDMKPGEIRNLPGLPDDMVVSYSEIKQRPRGPPHGGPGGPPPRSGGPPPRSGGPDEPPSSGCPGGPPEGQKFGPPMPGGQPPWWDAVDGSIALLINTSDDLEHPFIKYVAKQIRKPVWGVGPLLPEQYWRSAGSIIHDCAIRPNRKSNYTEDEVIQWLDSKPRGSVIYISFGSEVGPTLEEYNQLADALAESSHPFIWVIQPGLGKSGPPRAFFGGTKAGRDEVEEEGYYPHGLENKVGDRGLMIRGWAPQLMILSHPSTGGFLSHCGWNSTVEAIGRGVPILAWPIRGDQFYNAKLVVCHLGIGYMVTDGDFSDGVKKEYIVKGIDLLMSDAEVHRRAAALGSKFESGFPDTSVAALDAFREFIVHKSRARNIF